MQILDMTIFMEGGIVVESAFFEKVKDFDWESLRDKRIMVKGCGTTIIPPWAFMVVASRLTGVAKSVRYGNEHSSIPIFRKSRREAVNVEK